MYTAYFCNSRQSASGATVQVAYHTHATCINAPTYMQEQWACRCMLPLHTSPSTLQPSQHGTGTQGRPLSSHAHAAGAGEQQGVPDAAVAVHARTMVALRTQNTAASPGVCPVYMLKHWQPGHLLSMSSPAHVLQALSVRSALHATRNDGHKEVGSSTKALKAHSPGRCCAVLTGQPRQPPAPQGPPLQQQHPQQCAAAELGAPP